MKKQVLAGFLAASMIVTALSGCGGNTGTGTTDTATSTPKPSAAAGNSGTGNEMSEGAKMSDPGVFPIVEEKISFDVVISDETYIGDLNENTFGKWYEDKTNVHINYIEIPAGSVGEKVNLLLAGNELPDIFMGTAQSVPLYGSRGVFLALNDLIEQYGYETKKVFDENSTLLPGSITAVDGNIYALPSINACFHCMRSQKAWINQKWLDDLGLDYPQTTADLENVLIAFRDQDPNGNGIKDEIPMMGSASDANQRIYPFLLNSFTYFRDDNYTVVEDGKVNFVANSDEVREGLIWIKSLIDQNLIDVTSLTQTNEQLKIIGTNPDIAILGSAPSFLWWSAFGHDNDTPDQRSRQYVGLSPLEGPNGVRNAILTSTPVQANTFVITSKCAYPEVAFRWADGLYSQEVTLRSQVGEEGVYWDKPADGATGINGKPALYIQKQLSDDDTVRLNGRMDNIMLANRSSDFRLGEQADYSDPETQWNIEPRLYNTTADYYVPYGHDEKYVPTIAYTEDEATEVNLISTQINDYVKEAIVLFLTGSRDLEKDWDSYVNEFKALNLDRYMEIMNNAYERQYK